MGHDPVQSGPEPWLYLNRSLTELGSISGGGSLIPHCQEGLHRPWSFRSSYIVFLASGLCVDILFSLYSILRINGNSTYFHVSRTYLQAQFWIRDPRGLPGNLRKCLSQHLN